MQRPVPKPSMQRARNAIQSKVIMIGTAIWVVAEPGRMADPGSRPPSQDPRVLAPWIGRDAAATRTSVEGARLIVLRDDYGGPDRAA